MRHASGITRLDVSAGLTRRILALAMMFNFAGQTLPARAQNFDYLQPKPPKRLALVVGNAEYVGISRLPGSVPDAVKMNESLRRSGFETVLATNVRTRAEFLLVYFLPFLAKISEGDVAMFYFSGHGFAYGSDNYLVPLGFEAPVAPDDLVVTHISATGLQDELMRRKPSLLLMLLDACRNIAGFVVKAPQGRSDLIAKGLTAPRRHAENVIIGFSSEAGTESWGSASGDLSVYTRALEKQLSVADKEFEDVKRDIRIDVKYDTQSRQVPWFSESSSAEFYMKPSAAIVAQQELLWRATLKEGTRKGVFSFIERYGSGPYGAAARRWLASNPDAPEFSSSAVSPAGPEAVWMTGRSDISLIRFDGALRPQNSVSDAEVGVFEKLRTGSSMRTLDPSITLQNASASIGAEVLANLGEAIVATRIDGRSSPSFAASAVQELPPGKKIVISGVTRDSEQKVWLRGKFPGTSLEFYVPQAEASAGWSGESIGRSLVEFSAGARRDGLRGLIDERPVEAVMRKLRAENKQVLWASISTPKGEDKRGKEMNSLRAIHLRAVLARSGLERSRMTTIEETALPGPGIRVRLFGS